MTARPTTGPGTDTAALVKIEMIRHSRECLALGLLSLLPVVGFPLIFLAFLQARRVKRIGGSEWNPAHRLLSRGLACARWGVVVLALELFAAGAMCIQYINNR
jgi:hypothetical protein